ncbi:unnamed protein product [Soboliphyme baturini]|uniref:Uncharacterized protein n=1 Tax=Soboliphyme baturini TaxID=241478 RepID=A0A3P8F8H2_9BILA|nr:unnamed protein product [Soboliphyme baturini]
MITDFSQPPPAVVNQFYPNVASYFVSPYSQAQPLVPQYPYVTPPVDRSDKTGTSSSSFALVHASSTSRLAERQGEWKSRSPRTRYDSSHHSRTDNRSRHSYRHSRERSTSGLCRKLSDQRNSGHQRSRTAKEKADHHREADRKRKASGGTVQRYECTGNKRSFQRVASSSSTSSTHLPSNLPRRYAEKNNETVEPTQSEDRPSDVEEEPGQLDWEAEDDAEFNRQLIISKYNNNINMKCLFLVI